MGKKSGMFNDFKEIFSTLFLSLICGFYFCCCYFSHCKQPFEVFVAVFSPQECPVKGLEPQLWNGRHAILRHHRGERAGPFFALYISKYPFHVCPCGVYCSIYLSVLS